MNLNSKILPIFLLLATCSFAQTQKGDDIDGKAPEDESGLAMCMPDANTIAIGSPGNNDAFEYAGHVRVFSWDGSTWAMKGKAIEGEAYGDRSGGALSMPDGNTIAIAAPTNGGNGKQAGHVRIFRWADAAWIQKGKDIDGESKSDFSGYSVSMGDGNTVAIGAPRNEGSGKSEGHVRIFEWNGTKWEQKGDDLDGEGLLDEFGSAVSMPDNNTVAIGAPRNDGNGKDAGHVKIYDWNGTSWVQKGANIDGESEDDRSGFSVSMPDNNTVAIGAIQASGLGGEAAGHVRVFSWNGTTWEQKGDDLDGKLENDNFGNAVSMPDANTIAIAAIGNDKNGTEAGQVSVFVWGGFSWGQKGIDINGEFRGDESGTSVCMPDANTVGIGAHKNNGADGDSILSGHVRVYDLTNAPIAGVIRLDNSSLDIYPNPTRNEIYLDVKNHHHSKYDVKIASIDGRIIYESFGMSDSKVTVNPDLSSGVYFVEVRFVSGEVLAKKLIVQ